MSTVDLVSTGSWMLCVVTIVRNLLLPLVLFFLFYSFPFPFLLFYKTLFPPHFLLHTITSPSLPLFLLWVNFTIVPSFDTSKTSSLDLSISVCYTLSRVRLFATPWAVAHQSPLSMGFPRPDKWSGLPFSPPGDFADPGIKPGSPSLAGRFFTI